MKPIRDRVGLRFGRLLVMSRLSVQGYETLWCCKCDCGGEIKVRGPNLDSGNTKSCGCLNRRDAKVHQRPRIRPSRKGETKLSWEVMIKRCCNPKSDHYKDYGGRGVTVCDRWLDYNNFLKDMGERPLGTTIDRYPNNDGNYEPTNCRWGTPKQQANNRRNNRILTAFGKTQTLLEWSKEYKIPTGTLAGRLYAGNAIEDALTKAPYWTLRTKEMKDATYRNRKSTILITAFGKTQALVAWSEETGIKAAVISARIRNRGMTPEQALSAPLVDRANAWKQRKTRNKPRIAE